MASVGNRIQINLVAQDDISEQIKRTKANIRSLKADVVDLARRQESGEQGVQDELEQTRRELIRNQTELTTLGRKSADLKRDYKALGNEAVESSRRTTSAFDRVAEKLGMTGRATDKLRGKYERLDRTSSNVGRRSGVMAAGWGKVAGAAALATGAVAGLSGAFNMLSGSINEARTARKAAAQTVAVMRSMGRTEAPRELEKVINRLERISGIDGDNIREMTNVLLTFGNVTGDTLTTANELALDLSVAFGKDLQSSAVMVGKALNDPSKGLTALSRIGVQFTAEQQEQIKAMTGVGDVAGAQKIIIAELTRQVGGSAKAQADSIDKTQVAWGNLKEAIGETLMSTGTGLGLVKILNDATKWIKRNKVEIVSTLQQIMAGVFMVISVFLKWQSISLKTFGYIIGGVASLLSAMALLDPSLRDAADRATALADGFGEASEKADQASKKFRDLAKRTGDAGREANILKTRLKDVGIEVDNLNGKQVKNLLDNNPLAGVNRQGGQVPGRFAGGDVIAGQRYMVGEIGPELFMGRNGVEMVGENGPEVRSFDTSGVIIPNHLLGAAPVQAAAPQVTVNVPEQTGGNTFNITAHDPREAVREFERAQARQRRLQRERV